MAKLRKFLVGTGIIAGVAFGVSAICKWLYAPGKTVTVSVTETPDDFCDDNPEAAKTPADKEQGNEAATTEEAKETENKEPEPTDGKDSSTNE